jgi:CBS domain-containing protein
MKISSVMNPSVESCPPETTLTEAAMIMWRRDCGLVPVVDSSKRVLGVITDRDICMAVTTKHANPDSLQVKETMSDRVWTVKGEDELERALDVMRDHQVHRLPVVDQAGRLVGILSFSDVLRRATIDGQIRTIGDHDLVTTYRKIKTPRNEDQLATRFAETDRLVGEPRRS